LISNLRQLTKKKAFSKVSGDFNARPGYRKRIIKLVPFKNSCSSNLKRLYKKIYIYDAKIYETNTLRKRIHIFCCVSRILGGNWEKNLAAIHSHLHQRILLPATVWFSLAWGFYNKSWKWVGGLALFTLSLCSRLKVAWFFSNFNFIYMYTKIHFFLIPYHPYGFRNPYKIIEQWWKLEFVHE